MKKGQMTLDLMIAVLISIFVITWLQGYVKVQVKTTENQGITQETASIAMSTGSIMNSFYALDPSDGDYAELPNSSFKSFTEQVDLQLKKEGNDQSIEANSTYGSKSTIYKYPVPTGINYQSTCTETGEGSCVKG